ncbi:thiamine pyrophosphate-binding protein [uncultured Methanoregula sp.]|uniref:thiamine pyrophosphate-binding protein n=1 Tax=uncultured Methanoregula sp. TaxID=1005933 RepID=UPI002AAAB430|nr:thiamine pyrophosphate-binding protein [uncultured Methanoregula sp.]
MQRVADYIAEFCVKIGVPDIFLVSGGGMMHILDGLACNKKVHVICAHHEGAAAVMAEGYARITNNIGAVFVTTGPGGTNAITGVVDAWVDSIPLLVISGQAKRSQNIYNSPVPGLRSLGGQEVNMLPIVESFTKYSAMVNEAEKIRYHLEKAVYYAKSGRPGPSWLDIPLDIQAAMINPDTLEPFVPEVPEINEKLLNDQVDATFELLRSSKRPVIIAGNGVRLAHAENEFLTLVDALRIPVVVSKLGQDLINENHLYFVGFGGTKGRRAANFAMQNADLILSIGSRLAIPFTGYEYELFAREAKKIAVDIDSSELQKNTIKLDIPIQADAKQFIEKLQKRVKNNSLDEKLPWIEKCRHWKNKYPVITSEIVNQTTPINTYNFFDKLSDLLKERAIIIGDAGTVFCIISQVHQVKTDQRVITPAALGTMGLSLPLAIGAYFAAPDSTLVAVTGDGSLQMNIQELQTLVHYKIPLKLFVINNNGYVSIRNTQNAYFEGRFCGSDPGSGVSCPNLKKIANAYGIHYESVHEDQDLDKKLKVVLGYQGPVICEIFVSTNQQITPSVSSRVLPDGKMISMPLEDMWPFLPRDEFRKEMIIDPIRIDDENE